MNAKKISHADDLDSRASDLRQHAYEDVLRPLLNGAKRYSSNANVKRWHEQVRESSQVARRFLHAQE